MRDSLARPTAAARALRLTAALMAFHCCCIQRGHRETGLQEEATGVAQWMGSTRGGCCCDARCLDHQCESVVGAIRLRILAHSPARSFEQRVAEPCRTCSAGLDERTPEKQSAQESNRGKGAGARTA